MGKVEWCNWTFLECLKPKQKWTVSRDCGNDDITLSRGDSKNWLAYKKSLEPHPQGTTPGAKCPNCGKNVNGVNPYDDGETGESKL